MLKYFYKRILVKSIERLIRRIYTTINYLFNRKQIKPIFVVASARSGSYLLLSYLCSHSEIDTVDESLNPDMVRGIRTKFVSKLELMFHIKASLNMGKADQTVIKILEEQMLNHNLHINELRQEFPQAKFIVLYRQSLTEQYISKRLADLSNVWKSSSKEFQNYKTEDKAITIDAQEFQDYCRNMREFYNNIFNQDWASDQILALSYEDLQSCPQEIFDGKVFPFLSVSSVEIETNLIKMNKKSTEEIVVNYDDVKDLLDQGSLELVTSN